MALRNFDFRVAIYIYVYFNMGVCVCVCVYDNIKLDIQLHMLINM